MLPSEFPVVYKYTSHGSADLIIRNCSLRFGRPTEMNDPFDAYIDDLFDSSLRERHREAAIAIVDMVEKDPAALSRYLGLPFEEVAAVSSMMRTGTEDQRNALLALVTSTAVEDLYPRLKAERDALEIRRTALIAQFRDSGIFCATRRKDNLLMWAHYAEQHRGVVFGFKPDPAVDSFLCLLEPVAYSASRPSFYDPIDPLKGARPKPEDMRAFNWYLTATKSPEWAYEEELRLVVPSFIPEGQPANFLLFHPHELVELYLGHRFAPDRRNAIVAAAKSLNIQVAIFQAKIARGAYGLTFEPIA
ncbi:DUF2971 domain-containing protein [Bosea thiooxidans]|uniref:DUF2971 domain-containing protein n=1 Tax=Bosea thiooxidans TaxID=53254 RepID=UPI0009EB6C75|nr:DUF2971 domain-containing protein [Bosea thiooxidans]